MPLLRLGVLLDAEAAEWRRPAERCQLLPQDASQRCGQCFLWGMPCCQCSSLILNSLEGLVAAGDLSAAHGRESWLCAALQEE